MSILTDILIASEDQASTILSTYPEENVWPSLHLKHLDNIKLAALLGALGATSEAEDLEGEACIVAQREDGPWVFLLPEVLQVSLAGLPNSEFRAVAERWAAHDELKFDEWSPEDVEPLVAMLKEHAEQSVATRGQLLLWMSV